MRIEYVFAGMYVSRLDEAMEWYERMLGRPPNIRPNDNEAMWQLADMASVYLVADEHQAGHSALTLFVGDLDEELRTLAGRGIPIGEVQTAPGMFRKVVVKDPDGNVIQLGENLSAGE